MTTAGDDDARAHPRARAQIEVEYRFGGTTGVGHSTDISEGGIFLHCDRVARAGSRVYLRLHLPGSRAGHPLAIVGVVKRTREPLTVAGNPAPQPGMGIEFEVAYARTRVQLADFVETMLTGGAIDPPPAIQELGEGAEARFGARLGGNGVLMQPAEIDRVFGFAARTSDENGARRFRIVIILVIVGLGLFLLERLISSP